MSIALHNNIVVTGHYGSGKTNLSLALAADFRTRGEDVVLADLDIVNPYFRSSDFRAFARENNIALVASEYASSSLDIPALTGRLDAQIMGKNRLIIDAGGDDAGALALGRYAPLLQETGYSMLYVVNTRRFLMKEPEDALALLREIEQAARLQATCIVNCTNLGTETTAEDIRASVPYMETLAKISGLPLAFTVVRRELADELDNFQDLFPVNIYVTTPWS